MKILRIVTVISVLLIVAFALLGWRVFWLQKFEADAYRDNSRMQTHAVIVDMPRRGVIIDHKKNILAASNKIDTVFAEPRAIINDDDVTKSVAIELQNILNIPGHEICGAIMESRNPGFVKLKVGIDPLERDRIKAAKREGKLPGIGIQSGWKRHYPMGGLLGHVIGFIGVEQKGLAGIELQYDSKLKGVAGKETYVVDAFRKPIGTSSDPEKAVDGLGLVLTIDASIQQFAREELIVQYKKYEAKSAIAIVMDPWTGAVLAMVSIPDFDPEKLNDAKQADMRNRALTDPYEPGSIFKPIVAAIALDAGTIGYKENIYCEKGYYAGKGFGKIGEWGNHRFENMTVREILAESSNIGMAKIGQKMGKKRLHDGVKLFGFGKKTGIDLPGEDTGTVRPVGKWDGYSVTRVPFGHEVNVTAIQIAKAYCILANGGSMIKPHIVKGIVNANGDLKELKGIANLTGRVLKAEVANWIVREAMVAVVEEGTGDKAKLDKWQVFGKTGTANIAGKGYDETNYVTSFVGGAPAERPEVVVLVSIRKPNRSLGIGYSGGRVAAPVAGNILEKTLTYLGTEARAADDEI